MGSRSSHHEQQPGVSQMEVQPLPTHRKTSSPLRDTGAAFDFDGKESQQEGAVYWINRLVRTESVDITNDPRIMSDNVISHRLAAFNNVVVAAMLLCTLAFAAVLVLAPTTKGRFCWKNLIALVGNLVVLCLNLFCVVVVIQQKYLVNRIATSGSMGFEMSKSLYLNKSFVSLRHLAISGFFNSLPIFILASAFQVWHMVSPRGHHLMSALVTCVPLLLVALLFWYVHHKQKVIFDEKLLKLQSYEEPMRLHMDHQVSGPHIRQKSIFGGD